MSVGWYVGNANDEAGEYRGWLLGHFIDPTAGAVRTTEALEVKWGIHLAGHRRPEWTTPGRPKKTPWSSRSAGLRFHKRYRSAEILATPQRGPAMTRLVMPDLDHLGAGDRRDFVGALWDLYREAGEPSARVASRWCRQAP